MKNLLLSLILLLPIYSSVNAADGVLSYGGGSAGYGEMSRLYIYKSGTFLYITHPNPSGAGRELECGDDEDEYNSFVLMMDGQDQGKKIYAALLTAFYEKRRVSFWITKCTDQEFWGKRRMEITDVYIPVE